MPNNYFIGFFCNIYFFICFDIGLMLLKKIICTAIFFFIDRFHLIFGKNRLNASVFTTNKRVRDLYHSKYSFINDTWINPRIIEDLIGCLSDSGNQIISVNINESNNSNRYFGDVIIEKYKSGRPIVKSSYDEGHFSYQYLGESRICGIHILRTWMGGGGSGVFCNIVLVTLNLVYNFKTTSNGWEKIGYFVINLIDTISLGDRYSGDIKYRYGFLTIQANQNKHASMKSTSKKILIL